MTEGDRRGGGSLKIYILPSKAGVVSRERTDVKGGPTSLLEKLMIDT